MKIINILVTIWWYNYLTLSFIQKTSITTIKQPNTAYKAKQEEIKKDLNKEVLGNSFLKHEFNRFVFFVKVQCFTQISCVKGASNLIKIGRILN